MATTTTGPGFSTITAGPVSSAAISFLVVAGQTLTPGGSITVGGDVLSLAPGVTGIVGINEQPEPAMGSSGLLGK